MESQNRVAPSRLAVLCAVAMAAGRAEAQDALRAWGAARFATDAYSVPAVDLAVQWQASAVLRSDGRVIMQGFNGLPDLPPAPVGGPYVQIAIGDGFGLALRADGAIDGVGTGAVPAAIPSLPANVTYVQVSANYDYAIALRSDGTAVAWGDNLYGQITLPTLPAGAAVLQVHAGWRSALLRLDTGDVVASGTTPLTVIPGLPIGVAFTELWGGDRHAIARRSDGVVVSWGDNSQGQGNVPGLPVGVTYTTMGLGSWHTVAARSDGQLAAWGDNAQGQCNVPPLPPGAVVAEIVAGAYHSSIRLANGTVLGCGWSSANPQPQLPAGARWLGLAAGTPMLGLGTDGSIVSFPEQAGWQPPVPLPPGVTNVAVAAGNQHSVVLRSDGRAVAWGDNGHGQCAIPPLPPGFQYTAVWAAYQRTALLRSDGVVLTLGYGTQALLPPPGTRYVDFAFTVNGSGTMLLRDDGAGLVINGAIATTFPSLPSGLRYVGIAAWGGGYAGLRSDGEIGWWGAQITPPAPLPPGVVYVGVAGHGGPLLARRSDGLIDASIGTQPGNWSLVADLLPGESYVEIAADYDQAFARVGPTSTYVTFASGCSGTLPAARLVPRDTPRVGATLSVRLFDLPNDLAVMLFGWQRTGPIPLGGIGMPGCNLEVSLDAAIALVGNGGQAEFDLAIPDTVSLVGVSFANQAAVVDLAANAAGLVLSNAAEGVVGHR